MGKFSYAVFEVVSLKILKIDIRKDGTITHHDLFHTILPSTWKIPYLNQKQSVIFSKVC